MIKWKPETGFVKVSYKYDSPHGAGPFKGVLYALPGEFAKGDSVSGMMGRATVVSVGRLKPIRVNPRKNVALVWHTFAGGTGAPPGKDSYQAITGELNGREMYMIDPLADSRGRFIHYAVKYFGVRGYENLASKRQIRNAKQIAQSHHESVLSGATSRPAFAGAVYANPRKSVKLHHARVVGKNPTTHKKKTLRRVAAGATRRYFAKTLSEKRYALQICIHGIWPTLMHFPHNAAGKAKAIAEGKYTHKKMPKEKLRVVSVVMK